jgi:hypothetical protein
MSLAVAAVNTLVSNTPAASRTDKLPAKLMDFFLVEATTHPPFSKAGGQLLLNENRGKSESFFFAHDDPFLAFVSGTIDTALAAYCLKI